MLMVYEGRVFMAPEERFWLQDLLGEDLLLPGSDSREAWVKWTHEARRTLDARMEAATADGVFGVEAALISIRKGLVESILDMLTGRL